MALDRCVLSLAMLGSDVYGLYFKLYCWNEDVQANTLNGNGHHPFIFNAIEIVQSGSGFWTSKSNATFVKMLSLIHAHILSLTYECSIHRFGNI